MRGLALAILLILPLAPPATALGGILDASPERVHAEFVVVPRPPQSEAAVEALTPAAETPRNELAAPAPSAVLVDPLDATEPLLPEVSLAARSAQTPRGLPESPLARPDAHGPEARSPAEPPSAPLPRAPERAALPLAALQRAPETARDAPVAPRSPRSSGPTAGGAPDAGEARPSPWRAEVVAAGGALALLATLALYHRLQGERLLAHGPRARLLDLLRERPGLRASQLARASGLSPSTTAYHLRRLAREGYVVAAGPGAHARYFVAGSIPCARRDAWLAEREDAALMAAIRAAPGASKSTLAMRLAIARATLRARLSRLESAGLIRMERGSRSVQVFPKETLS